MNNDISHVDYSILCDVYSCVSLLLKKILVIMQLSQYSSYKHIKKIGLLVEF